MKTKIRITPRANIEIMSGCENGYFSPLSSVAAIKDKIMRAKRKEPLKSIRLNLVFLGPEPSVSAEVVEFESLEMMFGR